MNRSLAGDDSADDGAVANDSDANNSLIANHSHLQ
ncbi:hypothetical protein J2S67_000130 [Pseudoglutamicibacter albus]|uniref:Uncharacterized protein n=1 Tax=Pseudoglutamicibacter albus TaxID=98671 RepID=A0ABU1YWY8_9MICC|nr:hypothetical protein [Pseudoglutamicibacter albus]